MTTESKEAYFEELKFFSAKLVEWTNTGISLLWDNQAWVFAQFVHIALRNELHR
jgi:hypothetical protein